MQTHTINAITLIKICRIWLRIVDIKENEKCNTYAPLYSFECTWVSNNPPVFTPDSPKNYIAEFFALLYCCTALKGSFLLTRCPKTSVINQQSPSVKMLRHPDSWRLQWQAALKCQSGSTNWYCSTLQNSK